MCACVRGRGSPTMTGFYVGHCWRAIDVSDDPSHGEKRLVSLSPMPSIVCVRANGTKVLLEKQREMCGMREM